MSDRESNHELQENGDDHGHSPARERSRSRSVSRRRSRSRSRSGHRSSHRKSSHRSHKRRSRSRSYSRSPRRHRRRHSRSRSRSRSRSHDRHRSSHRYSRSRSRSPRGGYGRRLMGPRDCPPPSSCVGVFGMNINTTESTLAHYFSEFGKIEKIQIVYDAKTGRSRGFGFIYYDNTDDAIAAKDKAAGMDIDGHRIRVDFSVTQRPHTPTPGIYMGKPMYRGGRRDDYYPPRYGYNRSPSPYRRRSRSYSYSPRRD